MAFNIKQEPIEVDELKCEEKSFIDRQYESELIFLNNMTKIDELIRDEDEFSSMLIEQSCAKVDNRISQKIVEKPDKTDHKDIYLKQLILEKKKILSQLTEMNKVEQKSATNHIKLEPLSLDEENLLYKKLDKFLESNNESNILLSESKLNELKRLRAKLELRSMKRKNFLKVFDIDSYVNELIDREKMKLLNIKKEEPKDTNNLNNIDNYDNDVIFESATLKTISNSDQDEIIEIDRVLDRFKNKNIFQNYENSSPIGMVNSRNDDIKCIISPYTKKILKPYVWKDFKSLPIKMELIKKICEHSANLFERTSIDYVHLRPEHVLPINMMCRQHFWPGIDISECLEYPDFTLVALYKKLIVGFAFLVPNSSHKEAYLTFIFVHPDWRNVKNNSLNNSNVSIAQYMLYYLIHSCNDCDITLHVSVSSPVVVFYQKFGFKIEEYIKNFYDKYYSDEHNLSKDAFLMRLSKN